MIFYRYKKYLKTTVYYYDNYGFINVFLSFNDVY